MQTLFFMCLTVTMTSICIVSSYDPYGGTGCLTATADAVIAWDVAKADGSCWQYCSTKKDTWCLTGTDCIKNQCHKLTKCSGVTCPPVSLVTEGCVTECTGPDPKACSNSELQNVIACENDKAVLRCTTPGKTIKIISANYGRNEPVEKVCPFNQSSVPTTNCTAQNSMSKVLAKCKGKGSCEVESSNSVFGDPCEGTYKYLNVQYNCV